ncbi:MAG: anti-sigma factor [Rhodococcus sp.]|nr:anti-sigma factor [Rhodococcus sp. (in: high G+C Gram-positive bacteria)]
MPDNRTGEQHDLLELAYPYALDAVSEAERAEIVGLLGTSSPDVAQQFARIVADTHETMALVGAGDALAPPPRLRERILLAIDQQPHAEVVALSDRRAARRKFLTRGVAAAAAAVLVGIGVTVAVRQADSPVPVVPTVEQVLASPDAHTQITEVAGGVLTVSASFESNAMVVLMEDVPPPPDGYVYQMWFNTAVGEPRSAGTMSASTMPPPEGSVLTALDSSVSVSVTVEPGTGSPQPTGDLVVTIPLS